MKLLRAFIAVSMVAFLAPQVAEAAYIDPNTGGMLFQVFAAISGLILVFSSRIRVVVNRYRRRLRESKAELDNGPGDESIE